MIKLLRIWNGKESLNLAFWGVFVPIFIFGRLVRWGLGALESEAAFLTFTVVIVILFPLKIYSLVSLWRCAPNTARPDSPFTLLSRVLVVLSLIPFVLLLFLLFGTLVGAL